MNIPDEAYLDHFIKFKLREAMEASDEEEILDPETRREKKDAALNGFFTTLSFVEHLS